MSTAEVLSPMSPASTVMPMNAFTQREQPPQLRMRTNTAPVVVEQDGSFQMDKVIKSGWLMKRGRKTKVLLSIPPPLPHLLISFSRTGNVAGSSSVVIASPPTKIRKNTKSTARSTSMSSQLLLSSRTRNVQTYSASFLHQRITISRANQQKIQTNGLTTSVELQPLPTATKSTFSTPQQTLTTSLTRSHLRSPTTQT